MYQLPLREVLNAKKQPKNQCIFEIIGLSDFNFCHFCSNFDKNDQCGTQSQRLRAEGTPF